MPDYVVFLLEYLIQGIDCLSLLQEYLGLIGDYPFLMRYDWLGQDGELCFGLADLGSADFYLLQQLVLDEAAVF